MKVIDKAYGMIYLYFPYHVKRANCMFMFIICCHAVLAYDILSVSCLAC